MMTRLSTILIILSIGSKEGLKVVVMPPSDYEDRTEITWDSPDSPEVTPKPIVKEEEEGEPYGGPEVDDP